MKNRLLQFLALFMAASMMFSCQDEFTEEDALQAQQLIDLAIYVFDESSVNQTPVAGANVELIQGGVTRTVTTDESGAAIFVGARVGGFIYAVSGTGFTKVVDEGFLDADNFRQGQETFAVGIYLEGADNTAIIRGRISIEKDLTNQTTEFADGIELLAFVYLDEAIRTFAVTTDAEGRYELIVPADFNSGSTQVQLRFPDLEIDQTIAFNRLSTESGSFPEVLPSIINVPTLFSMYDAALQNHNNYPTNISPVYAIVDEAPEGGTTAVISQVFVNSDGEITGVSFSNGGDYSLDADDVVNVTFTSLLGGSGATLSYDLTGTFDSNLANIECCDVSSRTLEGGSGYSSDLINFNSYERPTVDERDRIADLFIYPGTTTVFNADYGTGIYREDDLD